MLPIGSQPQTVLLPLTDIDAPIAKHQENALAGKVRIDTGTGKITVFVPLNDDDVEKLTRCAKTPESKAKIKEVADLVRDAEKAFGGTGQTRVPSPYEQQLDFIVPLLSIREGKRLVEFDSTILLEHSWKLSEKDASLPSSYDPLIRPLGKAGIVDVGSKGEVLTGELQKTSENDFISRLHQQVLALGPASEWSLELLVAWLDRHINHQDISIGESAEFLRKVIRGLMARSGLTDVGPLATDRYRLCSEIESCIQRHRETERKVAFQQFLLPEAGLTVSDEFTINFKSMGYEPSWLYEGGFQFKNHYFGPKPGELEEKKSDGGLKEEFQCAQFLDGLPEVKFWVRNLSRKKTSFRLHTSKDWFYPDFLCQLKDGRVMVVEYKGGHLFGDAEEKRAVGAVWASRSNGKCLFIMPTDMHFEEISNAIKASA